MPKRCPDQLLYQPPALRAKTSTPATGVARQHQPGPEDTLFALARVAAARVASSEVHSEYLSVFPARFTPEPMGAAAEPTAAPAFEEIVKLALRAGFRCVHGSVRGSVGEWFYPCRRGATAAHPAGFRRVHGSVRGSVGGWFCLGAYDVRIPE